MAFEDRGELFGRLFRILGMSHSLSLAQPATESQQVVAYIFRAREIVRRRTIQRRPRRVPPSRRAQS